MVLFPRVLFFSWVPARGSTVRANLRSVEGSTRHRTWGLIASAVFNGGGPF